MRIIWCMDPEIPSASDKIFRHFGPFFVLLPPIKTWKIKILKNFLMLNRCNINENHMMYGSWDTKCIRQNFFAILDHFLHFYPPKILKNQNFEKNEKTTWGYYHFTHVTINGNHMMYGSWDMEHDRWNFLSFGTFFFPFMPLTTRKIKILKKWKNCLEISFYTGATQMRIIWCMDPEIPSMSDSIFCYFGTFFTLLTP